MNRILTTALVGVAALSMAACQSQEVSVKKPNGESQSVVFYAGGDQLDDLLIINGVNYFVDVQYAWDDPLTDISFRDRKTGLRVNAECTTVTKNRYSGDEQCGEYTVYRSNFDLIPVNSTFKIKR